MVAGLAFVRNRRADRAGGVVVGVVETSLADAGLVFGLESVVDGLVAGCAVSGGGPSTVLAGKPAGIALEAWNVLIEVVSAAVLAFV